MLQVTSYKLQGKRGFTLIETMVALGIFVIITTIVFVGNGRFNNTLLLTNLAYDLALTVSRAQSYSTHIRPAGDIGNQNFDVGFGVHFKLGTGAGSQESDNVSFVLFADIFSGSSPNHLYDSGEFLERYIIRQGNKITKLTADGTEVDLLDITFIRPNPDANFYCGNIFDCSGASKVGIEVSSADGGNKKNIIIESTGQISVD